MTQAVTSHRFWLQRTLPTLSCFYSMPTPLHTVATSTASMPDILHSLQPRRPLYCWPHTDMQNTESGILSARHSWPVLATKSQSSLKYIRRPTLPTFAKRCYFFRKDLATTTPPSTTTNVTWHVLGKLASPHSTCGLERVDSQRRDEVRPSITLLCAAPSNVESHSNRQNTLENDCSHGKWTTPTT